MHKQPSKSGRVIALGTFDGLHPGHKSVINECVALAQRLNARAMVYTFWENPKSLFGLEPLKLISPEEKIEKLLSLGVDEVFCEHFTKNLSALSPSEFVDYMCESFSPKAFVCGEDYTFGAGGRGTSDMLKALCEIRGIDISIVPSVKIKTAGGYSEDKVSSSAIRQAILNGENEKAAKLLSGEAI